MNHPESVESVLAHYRYYKLYSSVSQYCSYQDALDRSSLFDGGVKLCPEFGQTAEAYMGMSTINHFMPTRR
jgi:hypothetical protein